MNALNWVAPQKTVCNRVNQQLAISGVCLIFAQMEIKHQVRMEFPTKKMLESNFGLVDDQGRADWSPV